MFEKWLSANRLVLRVFDMARITVEDCLNKEHNRFALVQLASQRAKQLLAGAKAKINDARDNRSVVVALREIADGQVRFMTDEESRIAKEMAERERQEAHEREQEAVANQDVKAREALDELFKSSPEVSEDDESDGSDDDEDVVDEDNDIDDDKDE